MVQSKAILAAAEAYLSMYHYWENKGAKRVITEVVEAVGFASKRRDDVAHGIVWGSITIDGHNYGSLSDAPRIQHRQNPSVH